MKKFQDLTGKVFGLLTVVKRVENKIYPSGFTRCQWLCVDHIGNYKIVTSQDLKRNSYILERNIHKNPSKKCEANKYPKRLIKLLQGIKSRCYNSNHQNYKNYGGRGIKICDEWLNDSSLFYDWAMANGYNKDAKYGECTIDRINENGNYEPSNCRFVSIKEQSRNLRKNINLTLNGITHCISEWSEILGIPKSSLKYKIQNGNIFELEKELLRHTDT